MTPLQKRRHSTRRQGTRRSTQRLVLPQLVACSNCHQPTRTHQTCPHCGYFKGKKVK
ncbi:MAG: 50S ribosomal protein L32 [Patescibacteria group bacterium]